MCALACVLHILGEFLSILQLYCSFQFLKGLFQPRGFCDFSAASHFQTAAYLLCWVMVLLSLEPRKCAPHYGEFSSVGEVMYETLHHLFIFALKKKREYKKSCFI